MSIPLKKKRAGVVTTGNEVFYGRIEDTFTPVIEDKLAEFDAEMAMHKVLADDPAAITAAIQEMLDAGMDMVFCTGGMSVDPDDQTPLAIKNTGARIVSYGAPVLPGAMFLLAYTEDNRPVVGLPGCVMYSKRTIFDLVLPSLMPMFRSQRPICPVSVRADCVSTVRSAPSRTVVLESRCSCEPVYTY